MTVIEVLKPRASEKKSQRRWAIASCSRTRWRLFVRPGHRGSEVPSLPSRLSQVLETTPAATPAANGRRPREDAQNARRIVAELGHEVSEEGRDRVAAPCVQWGNGERWLIHVLRSLDRCTDSVRTTILPVVVPASSSAWACRMSSSWYTRCRGTTASPAATASRKA